MTILLPGPLWVGTAGPTFAQFATPVVGLPVEQWTPVDPGTVTLTWIGGDGASPVTWTYGDGAYITKIDVGYYSALLEFDQPGRWQVKWVGTDPCASVSIAGFEVQETPF